MSSNESLSDRILAVIQEKIKKEGNEFINGIVNHPAFLNRLKKAILHKVNLENFQVTLSGDKLFISSEAKINNTGNPSIKSEQYRDNVSFSLLPSDNAQFLVLDVNKISNGEYLDASGKSDYTGSVIEEMEIFDENDNKVKEQSFTGVKYHRSSPFSSFSSVAYGAPQLNPKSNGILVNEERLASDFDHASMECFVREQNDLVSRNSIYISSTKDGRYDVTKEFGVDAIEDRQYPNSDMRHSPIAMEKQFYGVGKPSQTKFIVHGHEVSPEQFSALKQQAIMEVRQLQQAPSGYSR